MTELKSCPFCGDADAVVNGSDDQVCVWVSCPGCLASTNNRATAREAKEVWNNRKEQPGKIPDSKFEIGDHIGLIGCGRERQGIVLQKNWIVRRRGAHWVYFLIPAFGDQTIEAEEADYEKINIKESNG